MELSEDDVINIGIEKEDLAYHFYSDMSKNFPNPKISDLFKNLAFQELRHKKLLETFKKTRNFEEAKKIVYAEDESHKLYQKDQPVEEHIYSKNIEPIFKLAIDKEEQAYDFYNIEHLRTDNKELRKLLETLMDWELQHENILKKEFQKFLESKKNKE